MEWFATPLRQADLPDSMRSAQAIVWEECGNAHRDAPLRLPPTAINGVGRGPDCRQHPRPQHPPTPDVDRPEHRLYRRQPQHLAAGREAAGRRCAAPMAFLVEKGPG